MLDGARGRILDLEEMWAKQTAFLANAFGSSRRTIRAEDVLGRPFHRNWEAAQQKKANQTTEVTADGTSAADRLAAKDRARRERLRAREKK